MLFFDSYLHPTIHLTNSWNFFLKEVTKSSSIRAKVWLNIYQEMDQNSKTVNLGLRQNLGYENYTDTTVVLKD